MIGEGNSNQVDYAREGIVQVVWDLGSRTHYQWKGTVKGLYSQRE